MAWLRFTKRARRGLIALIGLLLPSLDGRLEAADPVQTLQLELVLNGQAANLIGTFQLLPDKRLASTRKELEEIGLKIPPGRKPDDLIALDDLPGLTYQYDEALQRLAITISDDLRRTKVYEASGPSPSPLPVRTDYGAVLNYNLRGSTGSWNPLDAATSAQRGFSATLDARAFSPYGTLSQSAIVLSSADQSEALRLDTAFAYSDRDSLVTYRAGDAISGGLAWSRPIRLGGLQVQRNFGLRPDLVTMPLPAFTGSAAVPSTVDVYVNNLKTFSQDVASGPYQLANIPVVSGAGTVNLVIRDAAGHEVKQSLPFYASNRLLAPGLADYSFEAGFPRVNYGTPSDAYVGSPVASATLRRGIFEGVTVEAHGELESTLVNGGAGLLVGLGRAGVVSAAVSASTHLGRTGLQLYGSYETKIGDVFLNASLRRTFGEYDDLASVTAQIRSSALPRISFAGLLQYLSPVPVIASDISRPPKALDRFSIGVPFAGYSLNVSFLDLDDGTQHSRIVSGSLSRSFGPRGTLSLTAFGDIRDRRNRGVFALWSVPLSPTITASAGVAADPSGITKTAEVVRPLEQLPGSYGFRLRANDGPLTGGTAAVSYRSSYGRVEALVEKAGDTSHSSVELEGAIATLGRGVFFANRIDDSFAVVETGVAGLDVYYENRFVGQTDASGRALIPSLRAYEKNKIAIDPRGLPVNADIDVVQEVVAPADRSGVRVNLAVRQDSRSAIVVLTRPDGKPLPVGAEGKLGADEQFFVGYDGRAFVKNLNPHNVVTVALPEGECRAAFDYVPQPDQQVVLAPAVCR